METPATRSTMGDPSWVSCQLQWHDARLKRKGTKELEGRGTARLLEGAATASAFEAYVEHILFPGLHPGQQLIEDKGWQLLFLPAYSPDCSPSEETFSKVKAFLRRTEARTREALQEAIVQALLTVTSQDAQGWFKHCGYVSLEERMREKVAQSFCSPLIVRNFIVMDHPLIKRS